VYEGIKAKIDTSTLLLFAAGGASVGAVAWLILEGISLINSASTTGERAAALQAIAAAFALIATLVLVGVTAWYALITRGILRQSGPVVAADLRIGWLSKMGPSVGGLTAPLSSLTSGPADERYSTPAWAICLRNSGNVATKVASVGVGSESQFSIRATYVLAGPQPVFQLDAHSGETVYIELDMVMAGLKAWRQVLGSLSMRVRAEVQLGSGVVVYSEWETLDSLW
jgi:hypothetical protein